MLNAQSDFVSLLAWAFLLKERLTQQRSLASLLWIIQRSQVKQCRRLWYLTCFFFAGFPSIGDRIFSNLFVQKWRQSIFFYVTDQSTFFRSMEYYQSGIDHLQFTSNFFRATSFKVNSLLLPYQHYHLRAPSAVYLLLWYHSEQLRMRFFNDYVKSHDYLNRNTFLPRRFRFQKTLFTYRARMNRKQFFRHLFLRQALAQRYSVVEFQGLNLWHQMPSFSDQLDWNHTVPLVQGWQLPLSLAARSLPLEHLAAPSQKFFLGFNFIQLNLWANALLANDPLTFGDLVRMDWTHFLLSLPLFVLYSAFRKWFWIWTRILTRLFVSSVYLEQRRYDFNYLLISSLSKAQKNLATAQRLYFLWQVIDFRVSTFWDVSMFDRWARILVYTNTQTAARMFRMNYQYYQYGLMVRRFLFKHAIFGAFKKIDLLFTQKFFALDFIYWRMCSNGGIYRDFLANGEFSIKTFYRKLALDHYANERFLSMRLVLEYILRDNGFYFTDGITWLGEWFNPWSLRAPFYRLPNGEYDPQETRWSFSRHMATAASVKFVLTALRRSPPLSLASFFLLLDGDNSYVSSCRLNRSFSTILGTIRAYRRYYHYYRTEPLRYFRRYPHKVYVVSRTDPSYRERWFSFADRMRRAGIKKSDLPYYPSDDKLDIMKELKGRSATAKWAQPPIYWIIR
jgi:hypothetical protein